MNNILLTWMPAPGTQISEYMSVTITAAKYQVFETRTKEIVADRLLQITRDINVSGCSSSLAPDRIRQ